MNKTVGEWLGTFVKWFLLSLIAASGLANLVFWFYIGKAFWYHQSHYLVIALLWLVVSLPNAIFRLIVSRKEKKHNSWL